MPSLLAWSFTRMSFALPVDRLRETKNLLAFHHPQPNYPLHILIVPKRPLKSLTSLPADSSDMLRDLLDSVKEIVTDLDLESQGYRLIVNGGAYQDLPQLHFHLVSGSPLQVESGEET